MRILFITSKNIGDAILTTSILEYIHDLHPDVKVTVVCGDRPASLFNAPYIEHVIPFEKKPYRLHWFDIWKACGFTLWDMIIDLRGAPLTYILPARKKIVWRPQKEEGHKIEQLARFMKVPSLPHPKIYPSDEAKKEAAKHLKGLKNPVALGATANWHAKCWANDKFAQLAVKLKETHFPDSDFVALGAPGDDKNIENLCALAPQGLVTPIVGKMDLQTTAAFIEKCVLFVGNDSGLMHLAASTGSPTLGLFGPSKDSVYHPVGPKCHWVRTDKSYAELIEIPEYDWQNPENMMDTLSVDKVLRAVEELLGPTKKAKKKVTKRK